MLDGLDSDPMTGGMRAPSPPLAADLMRARILTVTVTGVWSGVEALAARVLHHYTVYQIVWARYGVHLLFMLLVWGTRQPASLIATRRPAFQLGRSMLMVLMPASWAIAIGRGAPPTAVLAIFWLAPLMVLALAAAGLGERPRRQEWLMAGCGFVGTSLIFHPVVLPGTLNFVLALTMGLSFSLYIVMTRSLRSESTRVNLFLTALGVFVVLTPVMPWVWIAPSRHDLLIFAGIGLFGFVMLWLLDRLASAAPVSLTAPFLYLQVLFTALLAVFVGHLHPGRASIVGIGCILLAALVTWFGGRRPVLAEAT